MQFSIGVGVEGIDSDINWTESRVLVGWETRKRGFVAVRDPIGVRGQLLPRPRIRGAK
jgi:hypothetical protein